MKEKFHYTEPYLLAPQHPVTITLIGAGGSGSQMLTQLARIDQALKKIGHVGLHVTCFDDDIVTEANIARQLFSPGDIGLNKATVLITRLNQFFGSRWTAEPRRYCKSVNTSDRCSNITISCVDSVQARMAINDTLFRGKSQWTSNVNLEPFQKKFYWMDLGNAQNTGQFVIGTCTPIKQPDQKIKKGVKLQRMECELPTVFNKFPSFRKQKTKDTGPSCSLADALHKQDLFVNSMLVQAAAATLWKMFREGKINYHGAFINLKTMDISPIYL